MDVILTVLIVTLTSLVLIVGALYVIGTVVMTVVAAIDATVVGIRHRYGQSGRLRGTHYGTPAMHH
jgi:uncharacterized membrane protein YdfJ with MMPL/SSD domain